MSASTALWLIAATHIAYLLALTLRAVLGDREVRSDSAERALSLVLAWTALLWAPLVITTGLFARFVLDPLRLDLSWGADHGDSQTKPEKFTRKGRTMRRLVGWFPWVSVGTYTFPVWHKEADRRGTQVNRIVEVGFAHFGVCIIRVGLPVPDPEKQETTA